MTKYNSNRFALDGLIQKMWQIRDRMKAGDESPGTMQQWIFVRRVIARAVASRPPQPPAK